MNLSPLATATSLIVQISYDCFELAERRLLDDTIFSDFAISSSKSVFPVRATLDVLILDMVIEVLLRCYVFVNHYKFPV